MLFTKKIMVRLLLFNCPTVYTVSVGSSQKRRKPPNRTRKYCNICKAPIVKLTQHLLQHHNILDRTKRIELSKSAEKV